MQRSDNIFDTRTPMTKFGKTQVRRNAVFHLSGRNISITVHSDTLRARQAVSRAMVVTSNTKTKPHVREEFGYMYAVNYQGFLGELTRAERAIVDGEKDTFALWLKYCSNAVRNLKIEQYMAV